MKSSANNQNSSTNRISVISTSDRNANSTSLETTQQRLQAHSNATTSVGGTVRKANCETKNSRSCKKRNKMEEEHVQGPRQELFVPNQGFTELFCDFPVSYATTTVDPKPPSPPPLSQLPSRFLEATAAQSHSAPSTPFRGKVVLSKKERKEMSRLSKLQQDELLVAAEQQNEASGSLSVQSSPYRLRNCLAKINSKGLFASLHRNSQKSLLSFGSNNSENNQNGLSLELSPPPPAPSELADNNTTNTSACNNNEADYAEKLKNLPVRARKAHTSHMENYCLFDPVDFINEKAMRNRLSSTMAVTFETGLRDPLFSSRQDLYFGDTEIVPEVIYNEQQLDAAEEQQQQQEKGEESMQNFDHHNYFVIDPDELEKEPSNFDNVLPNAFTNEMFDHTQKRNSRLMQQQNSLELSEYANAPSNLELGAATEDMCMSQSQESKDSLTQTTVSSNTITNSSIALLESSSSSSCSSNAAMAITNAKTPKKKLCFMNLPSFSLEDACASNNSKKAQSVAQERAVSEIVSSDHMLHLQNLLLESKETALKSRTVPLESNYVLFNPGPVPSRNLQYKIKKPRPLSTHSDADSGFLSPCSPDELNAIKSNPSILVLQQCDSVQGYLEVIRISKKYFFNT